MDIFDYINVGLPDISIGDYKVDPKSNFISLEYDKYSLDRSNGGNSSLGNIFTIQLASNVEDIEEALLKNKEGKIRVKLPGGPSYTLQVTSIVPTYGPITNITIEGCSCGTQVTANRNSRVFKDMTISQIAEEVIRSNPDWELGEIEETEPVKDPCGDENMVFTQNNESDLSFLKNLSKSAKSKRTGVGDYSVIINDDNDKTVVSFKPKNITDEKKVYNFSIWDVSNAKSAKVVEFTPDLSMFNLAVYYGSGADPKVKEPDDKTQTLESNKITKEDRKGQDTLSGDTDLQYNKNRVDGYFERVSNYVNQATIVLHGIDYDIQLHDVISIYAYRSNGKLHYSSGRYYVMGIKNTINMGNMTQELTLFRDSTFNKREDGNGQTIRNDV